MGLLNPKPIGFASQPLVSTQTPGLFPMSFSKENKKQYTMVCCGISTKYILFGVGYSLLKRRQVTDILQKMQLARGGNSNTCNLRPVVITSLVVEQPGNSTVNCSLQGMYGHSLNFTSNFNGRLGALAT